MTEPAEPNRCLQCCWRMDKKHAGALCILVFGTLIGVLILAFAPLEAGRGRILSFFFGSLLMVLAIVIPVFVLLTSTVAELTCQEETGIVVVQ